MVGVLVRLPPILLAEWVRIQLKVKIENKMDKSFLQSSSVASEAVMAVRTVSSLALKKTMLDKYTRELDVTIRDLALLLFHIMF